MLWWWGRRPACQGPSCPGASDVGETPEVAGRTPAPLHRAASLNELAWVENSTRVEGVLYRAVQLADRLGDGQRPPGLFGEADAMFAGNGALPGEGLAEKLIQGSVGAAGGLRLAIVHHHIDMDVAVAGVAEAGDGQAVLRLQSSGEVE